MTAAYWNITISQEAGSFRSLLLVGSNCENNAQGSRAAS
jgi:hypothetical protein